MHKLILPALLAAGALAGCWSGEYRAGYSASAYSPSLVEVEPGVSVIADYDEPIFYSDNAYWRFDSGRWYRSPYYDRGWSYATPPSIIARIDNPYQYRHYRGGYGNGYAISGSRGYVQPGYRQPVYQPNYRQPVYQGNRQPVYQPNYRQPVYQGNRQPVYQPNYRQPVYQGNRQPVDQPRARTFGGDRRDGQGSVEVQGGVEVRDHRH